MKNYAYYLMYPPDNLSSKEILNNLYFSAKFGSFLDLLMYCLRWNICCGIYYYYFHYDKSGTFPHFIYFDMVICLIYSVHCVYELSWLWSLCYLYKLKKDCQINIATTTNDINFCFSLLIPYFPPGRGWCRVGCIWTNGQTCMLFVRGGKYL